MKKIVSIFLLVMIIASCSKLRYAWIVVETGHKILVGDIKRELLEKELIFPWFAGNYNSYTPYNRDAVKFLKKKRRHLKFVVFGGTWDDATQLHLPQFFKVMDEARVYKRRIKMFAVNKEIKTLGKKGNDFKITKIPTFIVFYDDKEVGRIVEAPKKNMETDIYNLVKDK